VFIVTKWDICNVTAIIVSASTVENLVIFKKIVGIREMATRRACTGQQASLPVSSANNLQNENTVITVVIIKSMATVIEGTLGGVTAELMLDSGLSISLVQCDVLKDAKNVVQVAAARPIQLVTASGDRLPILQHVRASVQLGELNVLHEFVLVKTLVAPVILGINFLQGNGLMLDFIQNPVAVSNRSPKVSSLTDNSVAIAKVVPIYEATPKRLIQACVISVNHEPEVDIVDNCAVPNYNAPLTSELPTCSSPNLHCVIEKYHRLFCTKPGYTEDAWYYIPTVGNPVKVPPKCIPAHYRAEVYQQIQQC